MDLPSDRDYSGKKASLRRNQDLIHNLLPACLRQRAGSFATANLARQMLSIPLARSQGAGGDGWRATERRS